MPRTASSVAHPAEPSAPRPVGDRMPPGRPRCAGLRRGLAGLGLLAAALPAWAADFGAALRIPGAQRPDLLLQRDASSAALPSCARLQGLAGGRHHRVQLISAQSGQPIVFELIEPKTFDCQRGHPLVLHGHGFGGSRTVDPAGTFLERLQGQGHAVISLDLRGFGESGGSVRVMDPNTDGRDLLQVLDWAESHLDFLAHDPQPGGGHNLVAGATGGSYGGMFQLLLHNLDAKRRLDALTPDITPHDLRDSLNPNGVIKTAWVALLVALGETGASQKLIGGLDPLIRETLVRGVATNTFPAGALPFFYYHSAKYFLDGLPAAQQTPMRFLGAGLSGSLGYDFPAVPPPPVSILFSQGMRDTLFNFNAGFANFQGYRARGGDVRLLSHEGGHILPGSGTVLSALAPLAPAQAALQASLGALGLSLPDTQAPAGPERCGRLDRLDATLAFLNEKLQPPAATPPSAAVAADLARLRSEVCLSLAPDQALWLSPARLAGANLVSARLPARSVPLAQGLSGAGSLVAPVFVPLSGLPADRRTLAGIGQLDLSLSAPLAALTPCVRARLGAAADPLLDLQLGCDPIVLVGWGARRGDGAPRLIDEQLTPLRGLKRHTLPMVGVAERLAPGETLGLLLHGAHLQYASSLSRDLLLPAVTVQGSVKVPLER